MSDEITRFFDISEFNLIMVSRKWNIELFLCLTYQRIMFIFGFFSDSSSDVKESVSHDSVESISLNLEG